MNSVVEGELIMSDDARRRGGVYMPVNVWKGGMSGVSEGRRGAG